jgi:DNA repair exonuclease SbcCD ATPase subunit
MKLLALSVEHFRCVRKSRIEFGPGLNILHGPNDLGKSSLAAAIRAALLLQMNSKEAEAFVCWQGGGDPFVELVFESEAQRIWRIRKTFGDHPQAFLEESRDGVDFHVEARGREVDGRLSEILRWGLAPPGGKGRPKGMPATFLSTALLAEQDGVAAIFGKALSEDSDDSGKKRLIEALQAAAEDPLFKSVLHIVQARFDEAFGSSGQKRRGKDSPWIKLREQIQRAEEDERQCEEQLQKTSAIESGLQELMSQRLDCQAALETAAGRLKFAEIRERLQERRKHLDEINMALGRLADAKSQHARLSQLAAQLATREAEAQESLTGIAKRVETAKEEVRVRSADQARERQLKQSTLEKNRAELLSKQSGNSAAVRQLRAIESLAERVGTVEAAAAELTKKIGALTTQHTEAAKALRELDGREGELLAIGQLIRARQARAGIAEAEKALAQTEAWRGQVRQYQSEAGAMESALSNIALPTAGELDSLKQLEHQIQIARAGVGVGLHVGLRPKRELSISVRRDGGNPELAVVKKKLFEAIANGDIVLDIDGVAEISLTGGRESARQEVARLQTRWMAEAEPLLRRTGLVSLDDVVAATKAWAKSVEEIEKLRQAASSVEQRISDQQDWSGMLADRRRELASAEAALTGKDGTALETVARKLKIADLAAAEKHLAGLRGQRPKLMERERSLEGELKTASALSAAKQKDLVTAREDLTAAQGSVEGYSDGLLTTLLDEQTQLTARVVEVEREFEKLDSGVDKGLADARAVLEAAEREYQAAQAGHFAIEDELRRTVSRRATLEGELKVLGEAAAKLDEVAARQAVAAIEAELVGVPDPAAVVSEETLAGLRSALQSVQHELREFEDAIQKKRGALQHVGGQVAKDRIEDARQALTLLRESEHSQEIEYDAWALLRETMLEAEQQEGVHLGRVLGGPIVQRFSELTEGRYGKLALGPDLNTDTIAVAGEGRSLNSLSVGTRDQLSIVFRLILAEQLQSAVVLDDQLTQSDAQRMGWVRDFIKQMAGKIQILVFTCRPGDYLIPAEMKSGRKGEYFSSSVKSVNLAQAIERSGS